MVVGTVVLYALVVVVSLLLICLILLQPSKGGGMGSAFGGVGESFLGAHAGSHLTKATVILTSVFFLLALILATLLGHGGNSSELNDLDDRLRKVEAAAPAAGLSGAAETPDKGVTPAPAAEEKK